MTTDISKSSVDQVIDLLIADNALTIEQLIPSDVDFTELTPLVDHPTGKNTGLLVASKPNSRYVGSVPITYNRMQVQQLSQYGDLTININENGGEIDILNAVNSAYGCNLSFDDVTLTDAELVDFDGEIVTFTAKATSLAWLGEIALIVKWNQAALSSILVNGNLDGLHWPVILGPLLAGTVAAENSNGTAINYASSVVMGDLQFIMNGTNNSAPDLYTDRQGYIFNLVTKANPSITSDIHSDGRSLNHCAVFDNMLYAFGGIGSNRTGIYDFKKYNPANDTWVDVNPSGTSPAPLAGGGNAVVGDKWYIFGGVERGVLPKNKNLYIYNHTLNSWTMEESSVTDDFKFCRMVAIEDVLYVIGGNDTTKSDFLSLNPAVDYVWSYNTQTKVWNKLAGLPVPLAGHVAQVVDGRIYVLGGYSLVSGANNANIFAYDPNLNEWTTIEPSTPSIARRDATAVVYNGEIILTGGNTGNVAASVYRVRIS